MQLFIVCFLILCSFVASNDEGLLFTYYSVWLMTI